MKTYNKHLDRYIDFKINFMKTDKFRIKVCPDLSLHVTAPYGCKEERIKEVLDESSIWIAKNVIRYEEAVLLGIHNPIVQDSDIHILGKSYRVEIEVGNIDINLFNDVIKIHVEKIQDVQKVFDKWYAKKAKDLFDEILLNKFTIFKKKGYTMPKISVKKMHTRWGSCNKRLCKINLNYYLYSLPMQCIEYVIMHELVHLIYSNHKNEFYSFLSVCMPDWKQRKMIIDRKYILCDKD